MPHSEGFAKENVIKCSCSVWNSTVFGHLEDIMLLVNRMFVFTEILYNYLVSCVRGIGICRKINEGVLLSDAIIQRLINSDHQRY